MADLKSLLEYALTPSPTIFTIGLILLIIFPIALHFILHGGPSSTTTLPTILLLGPSSSGKTALLTLLDRRAPAPAATHTSQTPHAIELAVAEDTLTPYTADLDAAGARAKKFVLLDTPGHGKLRGAAMERVAAAASSASKIKGVVFVVDAAALAEVEGMSAAAEYLYEVLLVLQKRMGNGKGSKMAEGISVLIAANKMDLFTALPVALVKHGLETELARIRRSRSKGLLDSGVGTDEVEQEEGEWLGEYGSEKFGFGQMREFGIEVEVIGGNVTGQGAGVGKWWEWIAGQI